jgi:hypothetical protein
VDLLAESNEARELIPMLEKVRDDYGLERPPGEVLADGLMGTGANLHACEERKITLYSPVVAEPDAVVVRADPSQPVPDLERNMLPTRAAGKTRLLDKSALYTTPGTIVFGARKASGCFIRVRQSSSAAPVVVNDTAIGRTRRTARRAR